MEEIVLNTDAFVKRMTTIYENWRIANEGSSLSQADAIVVVVGATEVSYCKSISMQVWLFGYEMSDMIIILCKESIHVLSSAKKVDFVRGCEKHCGNDAIPTLHIHVRNKADKDKANMATLVEAIKASANGNKLGMFLKDKFQGDLASNWDALLKEDKLERVDITVDFSMVFAVKDDSEVSLVKKASTASMDLFNKFLREHLLDLIDKEKHVRHSKLASEVEKAFTNKKYVSGIDHTHLDTCYPPIIQSGGHYDIKFGAKVDDNSLHFSCITCMLGLRYKSYCSNVSRTLMVGPTQDMQDNYSLLLKAQEEAIDVFRHGVKLSEVYSRVVKVIKQGNPDLVKQLTKTFGFSTGLEFKDSNLLISERSDVVALKGMTFCLNVGLSNLTNPSSSDTEGKTYALVVGDTIVVNDQDTPASVLTPYKKQKKNVCIFLKEEDEEEEEEKEQPQIPEARNKLLANRTRTEMTSEDKRRVHQKELGERLQKDALERSEGHKVKDDDKKERKVKVSYKNPDNFPSKEADVRENKIYVDKKYETVVLPAYNTPCPFHISIIKNVSLSTTSDHTYFRINFFHPAISLGKNDTVIPANNSNLFIKEITIRSLNNKLPGEISSGSSNVNHTFRLIKEVQKRFKTREAEEREKEGITKQDTLIVNTNRGNPKLKDLFIRPNIVSKRITGSLEAHTNGFRYTSVRGDKVDILYNNIKAAFYQPCDGEVFILIHFHLKNAILFGKKKHIDVQFYTEVGEVITDLGKHQYSHDKDDLRAEQSERELRQKLKSAFRNFCEKAEAITKRKVEFETPFRDLGFHGAPNRSTVLIQPTTGYMINLTEWPPFVIGLDEIELVHFERVQFHLKNFDMVVVYRDYHRKVASVTAIPMSQLDSIKEWLNSCDIKYSEGIQTLNWTKIMKMVADNPMRFFTDGGWKFLEPESDDDNDDDDESEDDLYNPSDSVSEEEASGSGSGSDDSDWDGEDGDDDEDGSEEDLGSSEESGKDWDELEEEAKRADQDGEIVVGSSLHNSSHKKSHHSHHKHDKHRHSDKHKSPNKHKKHSPEKHKHKNGHVNGNKRRHGSGSDRDHHKKRRV